MQADHFDPAADLTPYCSLAVIGRLLRPREPPQPGLRISSIQPWLDLTALISESPRNYDGAWALKEGKETV